MDFPQAHWAQIHSTNPLERLNREIKRRSDVIGIFPNDDAIIRLVGALMLEQNVLGNVQTATKVAIGEDGGDEHGARMVRKRVIVEIERVRRGRPEQRRIGTQPPGCAQQQTRLARPPARGNDVAEHPCDRLVETGDENTDAIAKSVTDDRACRLVERPFSGRGCKCRKLVGVESQ